MSGYIWDLRDVGKTASVSYEILHTVQGKARNDFCRLCCTEKLEIINSLDDENYLNKRSEFISKCLHTRGRSIRTAS